MAGHIHSRSGKGSRASVSNWETDRTVEAEVVRVYGDLGEELGLAPKGSGAQWVIKGVVPADAGEEDEDSLVEMASIELFLRSQRDLSDRAKHQVREFYRRMLEEERRERIRRELDDLSGGAEST